MDKFEFDTILSEVMVERKPFDTTDIPSNMYSSLSEEIKQLLNELTVIEYKPDFSEDGRGFFEDFLDGDIQFYLVKFDGRTFFVDTQGYNYARYVGEIIY